MRPTASDLTAKMAQSLLCRSAPFLCYCSKMQGFVLVALQKQLCGSNSRQQVTSVASHPVSDWTPATHRAQPCLHTPLCNSMRVHDHAAPTAQANTVTKGTELSCGAHKCRFVSRWKAWRCLSQLWLKKRLYQSLRPVGQPPKVRPSLAWLSLLMHANCHIASPTHCIMSWTAAKP